MNKLFDARTISSWHSLGIALILPFVWTNSRLVPLLSCQLFHIKKRINLLNLVSLLWLGFLSLAFNALSKARWSVMTVNFFPYKYYLKFSIACTIPNFGYLEKYSIHGVFFLYDIINLEAYDNATQPSSVNCSRTAPNPKVEKSQSTGL